MNKVGFTKKKEKGKKKTTARTGKHEADGMNKA